MKRKLKKIPPFPNEDTERDFWATHDSTEYIDWSEAAKNPSFPNLKPSTRSISIRLPEWLITELKRLANKRDIPYQSLMKVFLADKVKEELKHIKRGVRGGRTRTPCGPGGRFCST